MPSLAPGETAVLIFNPAMLTIAETSFESMASMCLEGYRSALREMHGMPMSC